MLLLHRFVNRYVYEPPGAVGGRYGSGCFHLFKSFSVSENNIYHEWISHWRLCQFHFLLGPFVVWDHWLSYLHRRVIWYILLDLSIAASVQPSLVRDEGIDGRGTLCHHVSYCTDHCTVVVVVYLTVLVWADIADMLTEWSAHSASIQNRCDLPTAPWDSLPSTWNAEANDVVSWKIEAVCLTYSLAVIAGTSIGGNRFWLGAALKSYQHLRGFTIRDIQSVWLTT